MNYNFFHIVSVGVKVIIERDENKWIRSESNFFEFELNCKYCGGRPPRGGEHPY